MANSIKKIFLGSDDLADDFKDELKEFLENKGYKYVDLGLSEGDEIDFNTIIDEVGEKAGEHDDALGLIVFGKRYHVYD